MWVCRAKFFRMKKYNIKLEMAAPVTEIAGCSLIYRKKV